MRGLRVAIGALAILGVVALARAGLRAHEEQAPAPVPARTAPAATRAPVKAPAPEAWRERARPPAEVPPGVVARLARRAAARAETCSPDGAPSDPSAPFPEARCVKANADVEIDWNGASSSAR